MSRWNVEGEEGAWNLTEDGVILETYESHDDALDRQRSYENCDHPYVSLGQRHADEIEFQCEHCGKFAYSPIPSNMKWED